MSISMEPFNKQLSPLSTSSSEDLLPDAFAMFEAFQYSSSSLSTFFQNNEDYNGCADAICEHVSQILREDDGVTNSRSKELQGIDPTPIDPHGRNVVIVSTYSTSNDSNLWDDAFRQDLASLLSSEDAAKKNSTIMSKNSNSSFCGRSSNSGSYKRDLFSMNGDANSPPTATETPLHIFPELLTNSILASKEPVNVPLLHPVAKKQKMDDGNVDYNEERNECSEDDDMETSLGNKKDRRIEKWETKFQELIQYKQIYGNCCVPNLFPDNPKLAQWVKRQRYQYKLKMEGKHSTMTQKRLQALEDNGFVWDSHETSWMERWNELKDFYSVNGHSNVLTNYDENRTLSIWVKCQRRQYKLFRTGRPTNMTLDRIAKMESLDFNWNPRNL